MTASTVVTVIDFRTASLIQQETALTRSSDRSLALTPIARVALIGVGLIACYEMFRDPPPSTTLEAASAERPLIVRLTDRSFDFPVLEARVHLPPGWTFLSTTNPALATAPTFVNEAQQVVIRLTSAYGIEQAAMEVERERYEWDHHVIDWLVTEPQEHAIDMRISGWPLPMRWSVRPHQRVGLLTGPNVAVMLAVIGPNVGGEETIRQFCLGIEPLISP